MPTAEEIIVALTSQGAGQVEDDLKAVQEQTKQTTDEVEDTTAQLGGLADKFQGAMTAIMAGFAIATGGLLTQVPVLGETLSALGTVLDTLGLKIDSAIRPAVSSLNQDLLDLSEDINKEDGVLSSLQTLVEGLGQIGLDAIEFSIDKNVIKGASDKIIRFVFPELKKKDVLGAVFDINLTGAGILTFLFGGLTLTAGGLLSALPFVGLSITSGALLSAVFGAVALTGG
jgi:hypothetical protein